MRLALVLCLLALAGCSKSPGDTCFTTARGDLKDPSTATLVKWRALSSDLVGIEVRASNSFGGFEHRWAHCTADGKVKWFQDRVTALMPE